MTLRRFSSPVRTDPSLPLVRRSKRLLSSSERQLFLHVYNYDLKLELWQFLRC